MKKKTITTTKQPLAVSSETVRSLSETTLGFVAGNGVPWQSYPYKVCLQ